MVLLFFSAESQAQKNLSRTYISEGIENIGIDGNGVHTLKILAMPVEEISVNVYLEGETSEEIVIKEQLKSNQLILGFGSWPLAKTYNDKLSAHKIVSVTVVVSVPERLFVSVTSNSTAVFAEGTFAFLSIDIEDKACVVTNFNGDAQLQTNQGAIEVFVQNNSTRAVAKTTYGTLQNMLNTTGIYT
ncbi:MAG: hypothetical protein CMC70_06550, partial [Flavobacteriaceae bacterium]|nr:hypothetical protein [Flavobacteriaceae bacterium]